MKLIIIILFFNLSLYSQNSNNLKDYFKINNNSIYHNNINILNIKNDSIYSQDGNFLGFFKNNIYYKNNKQISYIRNDKIYDISSDKVLIFENYFYLTDFKITFNENIKMVGFIYFYVK